MRAPNSKGNFRSATKGVRRCDVCEEAMLEEQNTKISTVKGIIAKRHVKCTEEANG